MLRGLKNNKGIVLFIVLATVLVVVVLANVVISIIASQSRLTHHQVSRIQAYYASWLGVNLAYDGLRRGDANWPAPLNGESYTRFVCRAIDDSGPSPCVSIPPPIIETQLPHPVRFIQVSVVDRNHAGGGCNPPAGVNVCINSTANYTYSD